MLPVRTGSPYLIWHDPREATRLLRYALPRQGFTHTYQSSGTSVPSVPTELTVRCEDGSFVWTEEGGAPVTHHFDDPVGAAHRIAARVRQLGRRLEPSHTPIDSVCGPTV